MVLGGKDRVFHPGLPGQGRPNLWVILAWVEFIEIRLVSFVADALNTPHPFPPGRNGIQTPMDEHAKPVG